MFALAIHQSARPLVMLQGLNVGGSCYWLHDCDISQLFKQFVVNIFDSKSHELLISRFAIGPVETVINTLHE